MKLIIGVLAELDFGGARHAKTTNSLRSLNRLRRGHHNRTGE